jgi:hypothetical protein
MVRRFLLTALAVVLAVALPASAEGPASEPRLDPASCPPLDATCLDGLAVPTCDPWDLICPAESASSPETSGETGLTGCRPYSMDLSQGSLQGLIVDPDGCIYEFLRRTLGWPPVEWAAPTVDALAAPFALPF